MPVSVGELLAYLRVDSAGFDAKIASAQGEMRAAAGSADAMEGAVTASSAALAGAGRMAGVASSGTAKFKAAQLSAVAATERYNKVLADSSASTERLASAEASVLRANARVTDSTRAQSAALAANSKAYLETQLAAARNAASANAASVAAAESSSRLGGATSSLLRSGRMLLGLGAAFGVFEAVKKAIDFTKQANEFQRSMVQIQTNTGATKAELAGMGDQLLKMSGQVATAPDKLATSLYHVISVGLRSGQALDVVRIAAEGAKVGNADLEETTNALTSTVASGIPGVKDMSSAMGELITIVGSGDMKLADLNEALGTGILTKMKTYGLSLTDVGGALATFGDLNIRGAEAATQLRMGVEAMAKPAKGGAEALHSIGLEADTLRKDMQEGGLNKAILDLNAHLKAAGITGSAVGGFLLDAFSKKGASGVTLLVSNLDRLESKFKILHDSGATFGDKWKATTETASYALQHFEVKLQAAAITLTAKLGPSIAAAANWLGTTLPHAAKMLLDIIGPLAHMVGPVLAGAFQLLARVLRAAVGALSAVGHTLQGHKALVTGVATAVLALWAAFKGVAIAKAALTTLDLALGRLAAKAPQVGQSIASSFMGVGPAIVGIGVVLAAGVYEWQKHKAAAAAAAAEEKANIQALTETIKQDNGAIGDNTRAWVLNRLQQAGSLDLANKLGLSYETITDAALGSATAVNTVGTALAKLPKGKVAQAFLGGSLGPILGLGSTVKAAAHAYDQLTAAERLHQTVIDGGTAAVKAQSNALGVSVGAYLDAEIAAQKSTDQARQQMIAWQRENDAGDILATTLDKLAGKSISYAQAANQFQQQLLTAVPKTGGGVDTSTAQGKLTAATAAAAIAQEKYNAAVAKGKPAQIEAAHLRLLRAQDAVTAATHGLTAAQVKNAKAAAADSTSLAGMSEAAVQNRGNLITLVQSAEQAAEAYGNVHKSSGAARSKLVELRQSIIDNAVAHGEDRRAVTRYIDSILKIPKTVPPTKLDVDTAAAISHVNSVHDAINNIPRWLTLHVGVNNDVGKAVHDAVNNIPGHAAGGTVPGSGDSDNQLSRLTPGEEVTPKRQAIKYRTLLKAIAADNVQSGGGYSGMNNAPAGSKHITIEKFEQNITYPEPEPVSKLTPRALRMAQIPLASF